MPTSQKQGCLSLLFPFLKPAASAPQELPYRLRDDFLSPAEFSFYKVLCLLGAGRFSVQSKVRLADIFFVARPNENMRFFNRIAARHLDFLVCDALTMKPLLGIELDDSSHQRADRQERDEFVESIFQVARLPLLRIPVRREYNSREIAALLAPYLKIEAPAPTPVPATPPAAQAASAPLCPKCGIPMVLRIVTRGEHKGRQFYGCRNFPNCREMKAVIGY